MFTNFMTDGSSIVMLVVVLVVMAFAAVRLDRRERSYAKAVAHRGQVVDQLARIPKTWSL